MRFDIHHHHTSELSPEVRGALGVINHKLDQLLRRMDDMGEALNRALASLEKLTNAATGIETLIDTLVEEVRNTGTDDPKVLAALDAIDAKSAELVQKTLANTPAAAQVPPSSNTAAGQGSPPAAPTQQA